MLEVNVCECQAIRAGGQVLSIGMPYYSDFSLLVVGSELLVSWWKAEKERQGLRDKAEG